MRIITAFVLFGLVGMLGTPALSQEPEQKSQKNQQKQKAERPQRRGGGRGGAFMQMRQYDKDGNLWIEEEEFSSQFDDAMAKGKEAHAVLLKVFDTDGDGALNQKEAQAVRVFLWTLMRLQRHDKNRDFQIGAEEEEEAWADLSELARQYNQAMIDRFDKDADGKLSPEESAAGQKQFERRRQ